MIFFSLLYNKNGAPPPRTFNFIDMQNIKTCSLSQQGNSCEMMISSPFFSLIFLDVDGGILAVFWKLLSAWSDEITTLFNFLSRVMIRFLRFYLRHLLCCFAYSKFTWPLFKKLGNS